jgi:hypothetical protein
VVARQKDSLMTNPYYNPTGNPINGQGAYSAVMRNEFALIARGMTFFPQPPYNQGGLLRVNDSGTGFVTDSNWVFAFGLQDLGGKQPAALLVTGTTPATQNSNGPCSFASTRFQQGGIGVTLSTGTITIATPGVYWVWATLAGSLGQLQANNLKVTIAKNGSALSSGAGQAYSYGAFEPSMSLSAGTALTCAAGDTLQLLCPLGTASNQAINEFGCELLV